MLSNVFFLLFSGCFPPEESDLVAFRRLIEDGHSIADLSEEGESLISLACQSGYLELAQVRLPNQNLFVKSTVEIFRWLILVLGGIF
jgi:hypothetical protein